MADGYKYSDLTEQIIGCAMRVHSKLNNGHTEAVYQRCMAIEMKAAGLEFVQEADSPVYFDGMVVGRRRIDFLVAEKVNVELKSKAA